MLTMSNSAATSPSEKTPMEPDLFADFLMLAVPRVEQERSSWKYDVQDDFKTLTVYKLRYDCDKLAIRVATITDCLCFQFSYDASNPLGYKLKLRYTSSGKEMDTSYLARIIGKDAITSPFDVQLLLDYLDGTDRGKYIPKENVVVHRKLVPPIPTIPDDDFDLGGESEYVPELSRDGSSGRDVSVTVTDVPDGDVPMIPRRIKRSRDFDPSYEKKRKARKKAADARKKAKVGETTEEITVESLVALLENVAPLPVHPSSGGTIHSSQYWKTPADSRELLKNSAEIFVEVEVLRMLPDLRDTVPEIRYGETVKYGWLLLAHLLGGKEAMSLSFAYSSIHSTPISSKEVQRYIGEICETVVDHMGCSFVVDDPDKLREDLMRVVEWKMKPGNFDDTFAPKRKPSDVFLRWPLKKNSCPVPHKTQLAFGFDFYLDRTKLAEVEERYGTEYDTSQDVKAEQRWCRFGRDVILELIGGVQTLQEDLRKTPHGLVEVVGDYVMEAVYDRTRKRFDLDDNFTLEQFKTGVEECHDSTIEKLPDDITMVIASILFPTHPSAALARNHLAGSRDKPAEPGCNYWSTPAPHRTRLSPEYHFYVDSVRLAEYQRYLGPESEFKNKEWSGYAWSVAQHILGGEEKLVRKLLQAKKEDEEFISVLDPAIRQAFCDHVVKLFNQPEAIDDTRVRYSVRNFFQRQWSAYDKGTARWYFPDFDDRKKPDVLIELEAQEYWRKPASDRTQLRPGHDVYIRTKILDSIIASYGPQSKQNDIQKFSFALVAHMLGGVETAFALYKMAGTLPGHCRRLSFMLLLDDLIAVCLYADSVFHLAVSINPTALLRYGAVRFSKMAVSERVHRERMAKGGIAQSSKSLLSVVLNVP